MALQAVSMLILDTMNESENGMENEESIELPPEIEAMRDEMVKLVGVYENGAFNTSDAFAKLTSVVLGLQFQVISLKAELSLLQEGKHD